MTYKLGAGSLKELENVHPDLVKVVKRAIQITTVDFSVHDGIRTVAEQKRYVARGVSKTMNSKHLPQADGHGHAVDLVPWINGKLRWEWEPIFEIAKAMQTAARELGVKLRWGGCWDRVLNDIGDPKREEAAYVARRRAMKRGAFVDGPHYEVRT